MSILIVPYNGESAELTKVLKEYNVTIPKKKECKGGSCPIPKPLKMMSAAEVENSIANPLQKIYSCLVFIRISPSSVWMMSCHQAPLVPEYKRNGLAFSM